MFKRILAIAAMVCVLPALANAQDGTLVTWAKSAGGNIQTSLTGVIDSTSFKQTSAYGKTTKSYTNQGAVTVKVTANPGYQVVYEKVGCTGVENAVGASTFTCSEGVSSVYATFAYNPVKINLGATAGAGGKVNIAKIDNIFYGQKLLNPITFKFTPATGYKVSAITLNGGALTGLTTNPSNITNLAAGTAVAVTFPAGYEMLEGKALAATFAQDMTIAPTAKAGAPQTVTTETATLASASIGNVSSWNWVQTAGPSVLVNGVSTPVKATFGSPNAATTTVAGLTANGTYYFKLTVNGGTTATTTIIKTASILAAVQSQCVSCHTSNGVGVSPVNVYANWSGSAHKANLVICASCHVGANTSAHPGVAKTCAGCHTTTQNYHSVATATCSACHVNTNSHNVQNVKAGTITESHIAGAVAPGHAQYVSATVTCTNCHAGSNAAILAEYEASAHGNPAGEAWAHYNWRANDRAACQRCHNGTVFAAKLETLSDVTNYFGATPPVAAGEVLNCSACHSDVSTGALRAASTTFTVPMSNGATIAYDVPGASALCVRCHGGRESGDSVKLKSDAFTNLSFINSHYLAAGGMVYNKIGYEFTGQSYDDLGYHKNVGKDNAFGTGTAGPCVVCHMSAGQGHTWDFVTKDANGVITANNSTECVKCHAANMTAAAIEEAKESVHAGLAELQTALAAKGILFFNAHPYFYKDLNANGVYDAATEAGSGNAFKNWDAVYPGKGKDVMGAAFNFNLVEHDPGAYAHNRAYSLKLIADSIDFLNDGLVDGDANGAKTALATGIWKPAAGTSTNHSSIANDANCAGCHSAGINPTTADIQAALPDANGGCGSCHQGRVNSFITSVHFTTAENTTQSCAFCHSAAEHGGVVTCTPCHSAAMETAFHDAYATPGPAGTNCKDCHSGGGHPHSIKNTTAAALKTKCTECHSVGLKHVGNYVDENTGVRAITGEFTKRSHHVTGRAVKDSDCAVCHMEGKSDGGKVVMDPDFHMKDDKIYLRNGNTDLGQTPDKSVDGAYAWQPSNPDHTLMDQFCFSCHNAAGAPDAVVALTGVPSEAGYVRTALNPFGDSVSNDYDQVSRINVVGVYEQFDTGNSSHHAVRGQKYTSKNLTAAQFANISTANANFVENGVNKPIGALKTSNAANNYLKVGTMYETGKFTTTYTTLNNEELADDNVLHCGDCHTVGQFRAVDVDTAAGSFNKAVIGAHGSGNEYMLRNSNGDDVLAKDALVCYICHKENLYSNPGQTATSQTSGIIAHNSVNNSYGDCNGNGPNTAGLNGAARLWPEEGEMDDATFQTDVTEGKYPATGGSNIFGNKCLNCHNASDRKTFGGIHGNAGNASYTTYSGAKVATGAVTTVSRKPYRFLPGLGNFRYNGGDSAEQWTVKTLSQANKQGCYTLNGASTAAKTGDVAPNPSATRSPTYATAMDPTKKSPVVGAAIAGDNGILGSWGACTDHAGTSVFGGRATTRNLLRPLTY